MFKIFNRAQPMARLTQDPWDDPAIQRMSMRELADLPIARDYAALREGMARSEKAD